VELTMTLTADEIIERVIQRYDPDDLVDALEITTEELMDVPYFVDKLLDSLDKFGELE
jgi:hypothetical protein